jgi:hypothetical protein
VPGQGEGARLPDRTRAGAADAASARVLELLYVEGCPHYEALLTRLRQLLPEAPVGVSIRLRRITDESAAQRERFLGSPTVRVDAQDVEPGSRGRVDFGIKCRLYATGDGLRAMPLDSWILDALAPPTT